MSSLDPQAQALLDAAAASGLKPPFQLPVPEARERMRSVFITNDPPLELAEVSDLTETTPAGPVNVRVYRPSTGTVAPAIVYIHGGGWVVNDIDTHDHLCRRLALASGATTISVEFRPAPEFPYPTPVEDCFTAWRWILENADALGIDSERVALAGDSSGATLALTTAIKARDAGQPGARFLALSYPTTRPPNQTESYSERGVGYSLNGPFMEWFYEQYLPEEYDENDPLLFPVNADLSGLPDAVVFTAEFDPLRDEGRDLAEAFRAAGVTCEHVHLDDQMHGFLMQDKNIDVARDAITDLGVRLGRALEGSG